MVVKQVLIHGDSWHLWWEIAKGCDGPKVMVDPIDPLNPRSVQDLGG